MNPQPDRPNPEKKPEPQKKTPTQPGMTRRGFLAISTGVVAGLGALGIVDALQETKELNDQAERDRQATKQLNEQAERDRRATEEALATAERLRNGTNQLNDASREDIVNSIKSLSTGNYEDELMVLLHTPIGDVLSGSNLSQFQRRYVELVMIPGLDGEAMKKKGEQLLKEAQK